MDNKVLRNLSYGLFILGAKKYRNVGCIVNTAFQITSSPATIAISVNHDNYTNKIISETNEFSLSILKETVNPEVIGTFGYKSSKDFDKFENFETQEIDGLPVLKDNCGYIICKVINKMETNTHTVFLGEIVEMDNFVQENPITYKYYHEVLKGKSPKNAPTYVEEKKEDTKEENKEKKNVWRCTVCGYEVEMDELPDDFVCPICGQPKSAFVKVEE